MSGIKKQIVAELHKPIRRKFQRRHVLTRYVDDLWEIDLVDMQEYSRSNKGFRYILTVIDVFSKYAFVVGLKRKTAELVADAFEGIFIKEKRCPQLLNTDLGKEFYNKKFNDLMMRYGIKHYSTYSGMKASVVERFNRSLKEMMWRNFTLKGNSRWVDDISSILEEYNGRFHRTIKMSPKNVIEGGKAVEQQLRETVYNYDINTVEKAKFENGQHVRISKLKRQFEKGYTQNWSSEIFQIYRRSRQFSPEMYYLQDLNGEKVHGGFYAEELQAVKYPNGYLIEKILKKQGKKALVKYYGLGSDHNEWIDIESME